MDQISQTAQADLVDVEVATEIETKNIRVQTPCPVIEQKTIQTEDLVCLLLEVLALTN